jgi:hypothetical protein
LKSAHFNRLDDSCKSEVYVDIRTERLALWNVFLSRS